MWPIPARSDASMVIGLQNEQLSLSSISKSKSENHYYLNAYERIPLNSAEFHHGVLYNPTFIKNQIKQFIALNKLDNASVILTLTGSAIEEKIIFSQQASFEGHDVFQSDQNNLVNNSFYLFSHENSFAFLTYSIKKAQIAQYQIFATALQLNLTHIIIESYAHLKLYYALKGSTFRQNQLAQDLITNNNRFEKLIAYDDLKRILHINPQMNIKPQIESLYLAASLGAIIARTE